MLRAAIVSLSLVAILSSANAAEVPRMAFKIVSEDGAADRRSVVVRLPARIPEAELRRVADGIAAKRGAGSGRLTIKFYLDGMPLDQAPWAVASSYSEMKLAISGLKLEEAEMFLAELRHDRRHLVGAWLTSPPAVPGRLAILRDGGKLFAEWRLRNGMKTLEELAETKIGRGRRYDIKGEQSGHFVVTAAGDLELRQADKLIAVAERVALDKLPPAATASAPAPSPVEIPAAQPARAQAPIMRPLVSQPAAALDMPQTGLAAEAAVRESAPLPADATAPSSAPITAAAPKPQPRKRVARPQPTVQQPVKSAARHDAGPIMKLMGQ